MSKIEQISREVASLSEQQLEAALEFIRDLKREPFLHSAPPEAWESIARGREQASRGETIDLQELSRRLQRAAQRNDR